MITLFRLFIAILVGATVFPEIMREHDVIGVVTAVVCLTLFVGWPLLRAFVSWLILMLAFDRALIRHERRMRRGK